MYHIRMLEFQKDKLEKMGGRKLSRKLLKEISLN